MTKNYKLSNIKVLSPYQVDASEILEALKCIRNRSVLPIYNSQVCYSQSEEVQQVYKDWDKS